MKKLILHACVILLWTGITHAQANSTSSGTWPLTAAGTNAGVQQKNFVSSTITTAGITGFTSSGSLVCTDIYLETDATGLAGGTNFTITTNNANGVATLCAETVANLGASKTVACSNASVTKLVPFVWESGTILTLKCTVGNCTLAGKIFITPACQMLSAGASAS